MESQEHTAKKCRDSKKVLLATTSISTSSAKKIFHRPTMQFTYVRRALKVRERRRLEDADQLTSEM